MVLVLPSSIRSYAPVKRILDPFPVEVHFPTPSTLHADLMACPALLIVPSMTLLPFLDCATTTGLTSLFNSAPHLEKRSAISPFCLLYFVFCHVPQSLCPIDDSRPLSLPSSVHPSASKLIIRYFSPCISHVIRFFLRRPLLVPLLLAVYLKHSRSEA